MNTFRNRIRQSLADENLQIALDNNAQRRKAGRLAAFASLPDHPERRQRAHAIKAEVVAHLDEYLARFIEKVTSNGIIVHQAKDAQEAVQIVSEIVRGSAQKGEKQKTRNKIRVHPRSSAAPILVAKSKSMLSEEINLNHALEAEGIRVVETDLGEYIVQLR
ncbi:MAG: LUD domain-containing protein, partial [Chloroflexota bacterium]